MTLSMHHSSSINKLKDLLNKQSVPPVQLLVDLLENNDSIATDDLLNIVSGTRIKFFDNKVKIHILNNIQNGHCSEDCSYCAQRKNANKPIAQYKQKSDDEILQEAKMAFENGAFRYCMVTSGRGLTSKSTEHYAQLIKKIKAQYPLEICLSAGLVKETKYAKTLALAGLDKYNHNLNTSDTHYKSICSTHDYQDRLQTIDNLNNEGVSICSGVIVGMGESPKDLANVALDLRRKNVESIPVNFFLQVPDHAVKNPVNLNSDYCLRALCIFRIANPSSEIRMAAGREIHLQDRQLDALKVADSLFVSGYLNTHGSDISETIKMIYSGGYKIDTKSSDLPTQIKTLINNIANSQSEKDEKNMELKMKNLNDLRPLKK